MIVRKEKGKRVGHDHLNGIESFWSYVRNWLSLSVPQRASKTLPSLSGGNLLPFRPSRRSPL
ncbi:protein of unknown function [Paraburkholderia kururiensis]